MPARTLAGSYGTDTVITGARSFVSRVDDAIVSLPRPVELTLKRILYSPVYRRELWLLVRSRIASQANAEPRLFHVSHDKAATQYVGRLLSSLGHSVGETRYHLNGMAFRLGMPFADSDAGESIYHEALQRRGIFGPFNRLPPGVRDGDGYVKVLYVVRDPREILVSDYYSIAELHDYPAGRADALASRRLHALTIGVDRWVLERMTTVLTHFQALDAAARAGSWTTMRYEDLWSDFHQSVSMLANLVADSFGTVRIDPSTIRLEPPGGGPRTGRKVRRGAHRGTAEARLQAETYHALSDAFHEVLVRHGYI